MVLRQPLLEHGFNLLGTLESFVAILGHHFTTDRDQVSRRIGPIMLNAARRGGVISEFVFGVFTFAERGMASEQKIASTPEREEISLLIDVVFIRQSRDTHVNNL